MKSWNIQPNDILLLPPLARKNPKWQDLFRIFFAKLRYNFPEMRGFGILPKIHPIW